MSAKKSKLTTARAKRICDALAVGATLQSAAEYAGIHRDTLRHWIQKGERMHRGIYARLAEDVYEAQGRAKVAALATIARASKDGDWKAAAWFLERREPEGYGRQDKLDVSATVSATIDDTRAAKMLALLSDDALDELARLALEDEGDE